MSAPIFIGDEVSAAAYRLAGARIRVPAQKDVMSVMRAACSETDLVLITAEFASHLPPQELAQARAAIRPLVLVVPDVREKVPLPDLTTQLRSQLGVEA